MITRGYGTSTILTRGLGIYEISEILEHLYLYVDGNPNLLVNVLGNPYLNLEIDGNPHLSLSVNGQPFLNLQVGGNPIINYTVLGTLNDDILVGGNPNILLQIDGEFITEIPVLDDPNLLNLIEGLVENKVLDIKSDPEIINGEEVEDTGPNTDLDIEGNPIETLDI